MGFSLIDLSGKKFKEVEFKWMIFTEKPSSNRNIVDFQKRFNAIVKKFLDKYITAETCEEFLIGIDDIFASSVDILKENNANEVASKACQIKDKLYSIYDILTNGTPHEEAGKINLVIAKQRRSFATRLFQSRCQEVETFDEWFNALKELINEIKELYRVTDYGMTDISKWSNDTWFLHTAFLMLCRSTDEDVENYARDYWDEIMKLKDSCPDGGYGIDFIRKNPFNVIHHICADEGADKDYVMRCLNLDEVIN